MIRGVLIGLSLSLATLTVVVWALSDLSGHHGTLWQHHIRPTSTPVWSATVHDGGIRISRGPTLFFCGNGLTSDRIALAGFEHDRLYYGCGEERTLKRSLRVPLWSAVLLFLAYPLAALFGPHAQRRRRRRRGLCEECGYNLTGNESGVCPECGKPI